MNCFRRVKSKRKNLLAPLGEGPIGATKVKCNNLILLACNELAKLKIFKITLIALNT
jgi:hypothetical protein